MMGKLVSVLLTYVIEELRFCQRDNNNNPGCPFELIILKDTRQVCPWEFNRASISGSNVL